MAVAVTQGRLELTVPTAVKAGPVGGQVPELGCVAPVCRRDRNPWRLDPERKYDALPQ